MGLYSTNQNDINIITSVLVILALLQFIGNSSIRGQGQVTEELCKAVTGFVPPLAYIGQIIVIIILGMLLGNTTSISESIKKDTGEVEVKRKTPFEKIREIPAIVDIPSRIQSVMLLLIFIPIIALTITNSIDGVFRGRSCTAEPALKNAVYGLILINVGVLYELANLIYSFPNSENKYVIEMIAEEESGIYKIQKGDEKNTEKDSQNKFDENIKDTQKISENMFSNGQQPEENLYSDFYYNQF